MNLDDLLNSALDELEIQEKKKDKEEKKDNIPTTTTTTTNTSTPTPNIQNTNNNNSNNNDFNMNNLFSGLGLGGGDDIGKLSQQFNDLLKSSEFAELFNGSAELGSNDSNEKVSLPPGGPQPDFMPDMKELEDLKNSMNTDDMSEEEKKEFKDAYEKIEMLMKGVSNVFADTNNNNNNNNSNQSIPTQQQQPTININDFENSVSNTLKGIASNASKQQVPGSNESELLNNLFSMFSQQSGNPEETDQMDAFFEESLSYISKNYPTWIENNKDKYSEDDVQRFRKQAELFKELIKDNDNDSHQAQLLQQMSELGNLPESFCDEYLAKLESQYTPEPSK